MKNLNISNLFSLWELAGSKVGNYQNVKGINLSMISGSEWPNRLWSTSLLNLEKLHTAKSIIRKAKQPLKLSVFHEINTTLEDELSSIGFKLISTQTGMNLHLPDFEYENQNSNVQLELVQSYQQAHLWSELFIKSFGYVISRDTVAALISDISFYIIYHENQLAGTVFLYPTGETIGFHSLGVIQEMRKKGIAHATMIKLLLKSKFEGYTTASLQASDMAAGMYREIGFQKQYTMSNFQINHK